MENIKIELYAEELTQAKVIADPSNKKKGILEVPEHWIDRNAVIVLIGQSRKEKAATP